MKDKSIQFFIMMKCQKNVIILFASQWYWLVLFLKMEKKNYYAEVFPEECKHIVKEKEVTGHITEGLEISYEEENSDKE